MKSENTSGVSVAWLQYPYYYFSSQGHGYRKDLASMLANLKPKFLKFPGLSYLLSSFMWFISAGERIMPLHFFICDGSATICRTTRMYKVIQHCE